MSLINKKRLIVISLGGSLIYPKEGLNIDFLNAFNKLIRREVVRGAHFFIICGGGRVCRNYQQAARDVLGKIPDEDMDWLGIHTTRMNAQLLRTIFADICYPKVIYHYDEKEPAIEQPVVIAAGWKPGWSTDYCATLLAKEYQVSNIINLSNIDVVYDKDPQKYPNAKPIEKISWADFTKLVGDKWSPGVNLPFDPVATKLAQELDLTVFIVKGSDITNLGRLLNGKPFRGTIIMPFRLDASFFNREYFELGIGYSGYTTTLTGRFFAHLSNLYRALKIKIFLNPRTVLDIGCGVGHLVYYLRKLGIEAYGIEVSKYALSKANSGIRKYLTNGDILNLPYKDKQFDTTVSINVLEHINTNKLSRALNECNRVCRRYIIHKIYTEENSWIKRYHGSDPSHVSVYKRIWWSNLFKRLGYQEAQIFYPTLPSFMETIFVLNKKIT